MKTLQKIKQKEKTSQKAVNSNKWETEYYQQITYKKIII